VDNAGSFSGIKNVVMTELIIWLSGICIGYVACIWVPPMKPEKEIRYIERQSTIFPIRNEIPTEVPRPSGNTHTASVARTDKHGA